MLNTGLAVRNTMGARSGGPALTGLPLYGEGPPCTGNCKCDAWVTAGKQVHGTREALGLLSRWHHPPFNEDTELQKGIDDVTKVREASEHIHPLKTKDWVGCLRQKL